MLLKPQEGEILYLYLSTSHETVSLVLVREEPNGIQKLVYYLSRVLHDAGIRYPKAQKLVYALVVAMKCLWPYFQAHSVTVLMNQPLKATLQGPDTLRRIAKWTVKLDKFDITYGPWLAIKA